MSHEPYEEWLLSGEELTADQQQSLAEHLETCPDCANIFSAWKAVDQAMRSAPQVEPEPGFSSRWKQRLANRQESQQRRLIWISLSVCLGGALLMMIGLALPQINGLPSPIQLLSGLIFTVAEAIVTLQDATTWILSLLHGVPVVIPVLFWIAISTALLLWSLVWMIGIWRLPHLQRSQNETNH